MAIKPTQWNTADHDLLIEVSTILKGVSADVKTLSDTIGINIKDHEDRIRKIEKYQWIQMGAAGVVGAVISQAINLISGTVHLIGS